MKIHRVYASFLSSKYLLFMYMLCFIFSFAITQAQNNKSGKVLLLNSYHKGYKWTDEITRGVEETLEGKVSELYVEYLDTKRQFDEKYQQDLAQLLQHKHSLHKYDVIITSDDNAYSYVKKYREQIYGDIPIVFCGLNYYDIKQIKERENITGITELAEIKGNIRMIKNIHSNCNKVLVITDNTTTGKKIQQKVKQIIALQESGLPKIELLFDVSADELIDSISHLDRNTIVLYTFFFSDKNHQFIEFNQGAKMVSEHANVPVYGCWDFSMGYGIVGGYLTIGFDQGASAASMALEILSGTSPADIAIINKPLTKLQFDYRVVTALDIKTDKLPSEHEMLYEPTGFLKTYKRQIITITIIVLLLVAFIAVLSLILRNTNQVKKELEKKQIQLSSLIRNIPGAVYRCNIEKGWIIKVLNDNITKITGYKPIELIGKEISTYTRLIHQDDYQNVIDTINCALEANISWRMAYRVRHKSGKIIWVEESGRGVKDSTGKYIYADGIIHNITNEKIAREKLKESEEKYRLLSQELNTIIDNIPGIVYYKDTNNNYLYVNKYLADGHKKNKSWFTHKNVNDIYPNDLALKYQQDDMEVIHSKKPKLHFEEKWLNLKEDRWLLTSKIPLFDAENNIKGIIGVGIDITARKVFELKLKEKNKEYELLNEQLFKGNNKLLMAEKELKEHRNNLEELVKARTSEIGDLNKLLLEKNSELYATNDLLTKQKSELEDVIEELKVTHQQLIQSEKMASIGVLTAGIAHEINNPINFISSGLTGMEMILNDVVPLLENFRLNEEEHGLSPETINKSIENIPKLINSMRNGVVRTTEIVKSLRTFSRIESENKVKANIHELIDSTLVILKNKYKNRITIVKDYANIPPIYCYPAKLGQVILNLMINAMQAIVDEGEIRISVTLDKKKEKFNLSIIDNGSGMSKSVQAHIFDPFFTTKEVGEGTGLGLSIVHSIIDEHNGTIKCESKEGTGTEFIIEIPTR